MSWKFNSRILTKFNGSDQLTITCVIYRKYQMTVSSSNVPNLTRTHHPFRIQSDLQESGHPRLSSVAVFHPSTDHQLPYRVSDPRLQVVHHPYYPCSSWIWNRTHASQEEFQPGKFSKMRQPLASRIQTCLRGRRRAEKVHKYMI